MATGNRSLHAAICSGRLLQVVVGGGRQQRAAQRDKDKGGTPPPPPCRLWALVVHLLPSTPLLVPPPSSLLPLLERLQLLLHNNTVWTDSDHINSTSSVINHSQLLLALHVEMNVWKSEPHPELKRGAGGTAWNSPEASSAPPPEPLFAPPPSAKDTNTRRVSVFVCPGVNHSESVQVCVYTWLTFFCCSLQMSSHSTANWADSEHSTSYTHAHAHTHMHTRTHTKLMSESCSVEMVLFYAWKKTTYPYFTKAHSWGWVRWPWILYSSTVDPSNIQMWMFLPF